MTGTARSQPAPSFTFEEKLQARHGAPVAGVDEAGRGPWAGPVVAAAVILDPKNIPQGLNDSKKLIAKTRETLFHAISQTSCVGIGIAERERIDEDNILQATLWAMSTAVAALDDTPSAVLIDGNKCPALPCPAEALVRGDARSLSIAAASIMAKVTRDRIMRELARQCPGYGWERNKGYGTREHAGALGRLGVTRHHRRSFKPIREMLKT